MAMAGQARARESPMKAWRWVTRRGTVEEGGEMMCLWIEPERKDK